MSDLLENRVVCLEVTQANHAEDIKELVMTKDTQPVSLVANEWHEIEAIEDGTVFFNAWAGGKYI